MTVIFLGHMLSLRIINVLVLIISCCDISRAQVSDVLSFMISTDSDVKAADNKTSAVSADISGILSMISNSVNDRPSEVSPLGYISRVYSGCGYHKSGPIAGYDNNYTFNNSPVSVYHGLYAAEWGRITSGFGYRSSFRRMHKGVDIAMALGDTVRVPIRGRVERVGYEPGGYGLYIVVEHDDGMETRYAHLKRSMVSAGEYVAAGEAIALSGNTGNSSGPHLHFETRYHGVAIDPRSVFDFASGYRRKGLFTID